MMTKTRASARERILVVDDEEDLLELVNYNLSKEGYRVSCVGTGEEKDADSAGTNPLIIPSSRNFIAPSTRLLPPSVRAAAVLRQPRWRCRRRHNSGVGAPGMTRSCGAVPA